MKATWPSIDHGLLSPSGRMSKRARNAANERTRRELFGEGLSHPTFHETDATKRASDLNMAKFLRGVAAGGMGPRKHIKEAERLEAIWK